MADVSKKWIKSRTDYARYIKTEKRLSKNTVEAYMRDFDEFMHFMLRRYTVLPEDVNSTMIVKFMDWLYEQGQSAMSQARRFSGLKSFYNYLLLNDRIEQLPTDDVDSPKVVRTRPDVLTVAEMFTLAKQIAAAQTTVVPLMVAGLFYYIFNLLVITYFYNSCIIFKLRHASV